MADNENQFTENLRAEMGKLRSQMEELLKNAEAKRHELTDEMAHKIAHEVERARHIAAERTQKLREVGQTGLDEVEIQVRQNPLASVLIAFGLGWLISCLFRRMR